MITWITDAVGTAAYSELDAATLSAGVVADVRELVDKAGNAPEALQRQIDGALGILREKGRVVIACDRGVSRSRAIAIGVLGSSGWTLESALSRVNQVARNPEIDLSLFRELAQLVARPAAADRSDSQGVLVLGGRGFIGSNLVTLLKATRPVSAPARSEIDLRTDTLALSALVDAHGIQVVLFLAHPGAYHSSSAFADSLRMLKNSLEVAREHRLRFVYLSSMTVFNGNARRQGGEFAARETDAPLPFGTYSESKFFGEKLVELYAQNHGLRITIVRPSTAYGTGMPASSLIPKLAAMALRHEPIVTHEYSNGLPFLQLIHVRDLCSALELLLPAPRPPTHIHIAGADRCSTQALAAAIVELSGSRSRLSLARIRGEVQNVESTSSQKLRDLGWKPLIELKRGLQQIIAAVA